MPVLGFRDHWAMQCSLNLAGCRLRAESLARQLHTSLWSTSRHSSPGDSGTVSPCFGLPPAAPLLVVDRPPVKLRAMSSLDGDEDDEPLAQISPPYSPVESSALLRREEINGQCKDANPVWRPDSPPESFTSDSPALTVDTEEPNSSTASNSAETASEVASPTFDISEDGSPLAEELRSRLRLIQSSQTDTTADEITLASPSEEEDTSSNMDLLSPEPCPRLVRSTSLKTGKTPPGTPSHKKIVRFADALGLDLEAIRHFAKDDDAPIVPMSAFADLRIPTSSSAPLLLPTPWNGSAPPTCQLVAQFAQPGGEARFLDRVRQQKVSLENAIVRDLRVSGVVRVLNLGFEKSVVVRYTTTEWAAHTDLTADYVPHSCDGFSDKFSFVLHLPHLSPGQRLLFALRYEANGQEFWDNNGSENYVLRCVRTAENQEETSGPPRWLHHFM